MPVPPARTQLGMPSIASDPAATSASSTGGYDALSELVFVGFDSLQASTPERCRPFDRERTGLVLGEGAAILLLENLDSAQARGAKIMAEIIGYGISTDNHHLTQPNPSGSGPRQAMEGALQSARISAREIDYINAHGTATPFNDAAEGKAIAELFDGVAVSSTKGMMGHSLGAAGAIEAIISILALQNQFLPAKHQFSERRCGTGSEHHREQLPARQPAHGPVEFLRIRRHKRFRDYSDGREHEPGNRGHGMGNAARE